VTASCFRQAGSALLYSLLHLTGYELSLGKAIGEAQLAARYNTSQSTP
jgi:hypothetical protein